MLLGIVSDVHCNSDALDRALADLLPRVDKVLLAGDAVLQYRFSNEVIEAVRAYNMAYVAGNHEMTLIKHGQRALSTPHVRPYNVALMSRAPARLETRVSGKRLMMVHASPFDPFDEYLHVSNPHLARCAEVDADILVLGHTHVPMATRVGKVLVINPGSLGQGGDPDHPGMLSYGVLDTDSEEFTVHRFEYRITPAA